ncbi:MAG: RHS repeat-associated core domain-containing protein [Myxococcota bacterium]
MPFGFHTALKSEGTGLLYFRNRWYSTTAGQWLSRDALGPVDSHNLYAFNGFDSVNFVDPWGLSRGGTAQAGDDPPVYHPCTVASDPTCGARGGDDRGGLGAGGGGSGSGPSPIPGVDEDLGGGQFCFGPACGQASFVDGVTAGRSEAAAVAVLQPLVAPSTPSHATGPQRAGPAAGVLGGALDIVLAQSPGEFLRNPAKARWKNEEHANSRDVRDAVLERAFQLRHERVTQGEAIIDLLRTTLEVAEDARALALGLFQYAEPNWSMFRYDDTSIPTGLRPEYEDPGGAEQVHHALAAVAIPILSGDTDVARGLGFLHEAHTAAADDRPMEREDLMLNEASFGVARDILGGAPVETVLEGARRSFCANASCR